MLYLNSYLKIYITVALGLLMVSSSAYSQADSVGIVSLSLDNSLTLIKTDKQQAILEKITQRETTARLQIFKVSDITEIANSKGLRFGSQNKVVYSINSVGEKAIKGSRSFWQGKSEASDPNMTTLILDGMDITGSVWLDGQLYKIEPLGEGVHAFIKFDQSKVLKCVPPLEPEEERNEDKLLNKSNAVLQTDPPVLDVMNLEGR